MKSPKKNNSNSKNESLATPPQTTNQPEFIITPGLQSYVDEFELHCEEAKNKPILIVGPTGVGKSLFLNIFKNLFKIEKGMKGASDKEANIHTINCSHYSGETVRGELFGYVGGLFTGALEGGYDGLLKAAHKGVLILEEIGTLPKNTQAMLLTFIEDGKFRKLGGKEDEAHVHTRIVGSANSEKRIREDFSNRFFPFYIPPLHQRRIDILYLLSKKYPDLIPSLKPWELLALLSYYWPGNVRELERVASLFERKRKLGIKNKTVIDNFFQDSFPPIPHIPSEEFVRIWEELPVATDAQNVLGLLGSNLYGIGQNYTSLDLSLPLQLYMELLENNVSVKFLESILNKRYLGLSPKNRNTLLDLYIQKEKSKSKTNKSINASEINACERAFKPLFISDDRLDVLRFKVSNEFNKMKPLI